MAEEQCRLPVRLGGCGLTSMQLVAPAAYLGSWLGNLEGVRERCPEGTASKARFTTGDRDWAKALTDALAILAEEGVHLNDQGEVAPDPPQAGWTWEDDSAEVPQVQRALTKALDKKHRAEFLPRLPPEDRAWVRSCVGPGAGA